MRSVIASCSHSIGSPSQTGRQSRCAAYLDGTAGMSLSRGMSRSRSKNSLRSAQVSALVRTPRTNECTGQADLEASLHLPSDQLSPNFPDYLPACTGVLEVNGHGRLGWPLEAVGREDEQAMVRFKNAVSGIAFGSTRIDMHHSRHCAYYFARLGWFCASVAKSGDSMS